MRAIELHAASTVQTHQWLALPGLFVAYAKAVRLNVPLGEKGVWDSHCRAFITLHHWWSPSSPECATLGWKQSAPPVWRGHAPRRRPGGGELAPAAVRV